MDDFWGVTILLFIVLTIMIAMTIRAMSYFASYHQLRYKRERMSDCIGDLKSGDIILFVGHTHGFTNSIFTKDIFTHSAMVVEMDDGLHLSEATLDSMPNPVTGAEERLPASSQVNRLQRRLHNYPGMIFLMRLSRPLTPDQERILRERVQEVNPYPGAADMLKALVGISSKSRHCMQHVGWLLDEMGLTPKELAANGKKLAHTGFFDSSRVVTTLAGTALGPGGNKYEPVVELLYDLNGE